MSGSRKNVFSTAEEFISVMIAVIISGYEFERRIKNKLLIFIILKISVLFFLYLFISSFNSASFLSRPPA